MTFRLAIATAALILPSFATAEDGAPHWAYQGASGPVAWGELLEAYATCGTGSRQSPVSLPAAAERAAGVVMFDYRPTPIEILNNGHTVQVNHAPGSRIEVGGKYFELKQFHFHAPSEHVIDGVPAALEMHLVHAAEDGSLAVIGQLFDFGDENAWLAPIWADLPDEGPAEARVGELLVTELIDTDGEMIRYSGSLTTPPCSEGVSWFVFAEHAEVSRAQVAAFVELLGYNARPPQPLNDRLSAN
ncbi:MAG: carbonic anhydrase [Paracoccaceae bacterium]